MDNRRIVFNFRQGQEIFIFSKSSIRALEPTPAPITLATLSKGVDPEADLPSSLNVKVKNACS